VIGHIRALPRQRYPRLVEIAGAARTSSAEREFRAGLDARCWGSAPRAGHPAEEEDAIMTMQLWLSALAMAAGVAATLQAATNAGLARSAGLGAALVVKHGGRPDRRDRAVGGDGRKVDLLPGGRLLGAPTSAGSSAS
jgi:hypothetical protein